MEMSECKGNGISVDIIVPCYNEEQSVGVFFDAVEKVVGEIPGYDFSYIFIDDGSTDGTLEQIKKLAGAGSDGAPAEGENASAATAAPDRRVRYISFSRNFGKEAAMYAGLKASAQGRRAAIFGADPEDAATTASADGKPAADYAILIDVDLQHPPELIPEMIKTIEETGCDSCAARRVSRKGEPKIRSIFARAFYKVMNRFCDIEIVDGAVDFRMMSMKMVRAVVDMPESQRFSKGIFAWVGFDTRWIEFENVKRLSGESKWNVWSLTRYAISGFVDFAEAPLKFIGFMGGIVSVGAVIYLIIEIIKTLVLGKDVPGYESLICLILFFGGLVVTILSVIGQYIGRMYIETKRRPIYIEKESNFEDDRN